MIGYLYTICKLNVRILEYDVLILDYPGWLFFNKLMMTF